MTKKTMLQAITDICSYYENLKSDITLEDIAAMARDLLDASIYVLDDSLTLVGYTVSGNDECRLNHRESAARIARKVLGSSELNVTVARNGECPFGEGSCSFDERLHVTLPLIYSCDHIGTLICTRDGSEYDDAYIGLCKMLATLCAMALHNTLNRDKVDEARRKTGAALALQSLSYTEKQAVDAILGALPQVEAPGITEGLINASTISSKYGITRSVIASALKKLEGAGIISIRSLGMKGTHLTVLNPEIYTVTK
ncbi:MAG: hypothetical protein IKK58_05490 [Clostridia bacterium]|nr:hypothetical protein [Clostridia bacterium]